jgi:hypothetical protein
MTEKKRDEALISRLHRAFRTEYGRKWQLIRKKNETKNGAFKTKSALSRS